MQAQLPIVADVDLLIIGGTSAAVAAALSAHAAGARIYLIAPRPYLGDDLCAFLRLWLDEDDRPRNELAKVLFGGCSDRVPTPMQLKRTLEQELVRTQIPFLLNCQAIEAIRDSRDVLSGAVIVNRAGRQAILAKAMIDATWRSEFARRIGIPFRKWKPGRYTFTRTTLGGKAIETQAFRVHTPEAIAQVKGEEHSYPARIYSLDLEMPDASPCAFAHAEALGRQLTFDSGQVMGSERLYLLPPDPIETNLPPINYSPENFDWEQLRCRNENLWLLGPAANLTRSSAAVFVKPCHYLLAGERLGQQVAMTLPQIPSPHAPMLTAQKAPPVSEGRILFETHALRAGKKATQYLTVEPNRVPLLGDFDVLVIGGGTAGAPAAIAAARQGVRTLLCENCAELGGVGTVGMIGRYWFGNRVGFTAEVDRNVLQMGAGSPELAPKNGWNVEWKKAWYLEEIRRFGGTVWFETQLAGVWVVDGTVKGAILSGPHGYGLVKAKAIVDATGSADVAAAAGAETVTIGLDHIAVQGTGLPPRHPGENYTNTDHTFVDDNDPTDTTCALVSSKLKFGEAFDLGQLIDTRERRQIVAELNLAPVDFLCRRTFPDSICLSSSNFDTHGFTIHDVFHVKAPDKERLWVYVPFRSLLPRGINNVLVTGLGIGAHRDALPVVRMQADVQNQGFAAGVAAALAVREDIDFRSIDIRKLQQILIRQGNLDPEVLQHVDSFPLDDGQLNWAVDEGWDDIKGIALILANSERSEQLLKSSCESSACPHKKLRSAQLLALMGDDSGVNLLAQAILNMPWDNGWNYTGMGQFGMCASPLDNLITAISRIRSKTALQVLIKKMEELDPLQYFSHVRAVCDAAVALHSLDAERKLAPALYRLLMKPGIAGHAYCSVQDWQRDLSTSDRETERRNNALRELTLVRAIYLCGDHEEAGRNTLELYVEDIRGLFSRHARAVLHAAVQH